MYPTNVFCQVYNNRKDIPGDCLMQCLLESPHTYTDKYKYLIFLLTILISFSTLTNPYGIHFLVGVSVKYYICNNMQHLKIRYNIPLFLNAAYYY